MTSMSPPPARQAPFDKVHDITVPGVEGTFKAYTAGTAGPLVVLMHGGGHSAMTWALVSLSIKSHCQVLAYDFRGHGNSPDGEVSSENLVSDSLEIISQLYPPATPVFIVGHSMGGAIAARTAAAQKIQNLRGVILIDIVEGTAIESLPFMHDIINARPSHFDTVKDAIDWSIKTGAIHNRMSAQISIPAQLRENSEGQMEWRTDLRATEPYWKEWYLGLSELFLSLKAPKQLILAGTDRLDTPLTIAQMQGKFQLILMNACGHTIQEDAPGDVAKRIMNFVGRYA